MSILDDIVVHKRAELAGRMAGRPLESLKEIAEGREAAPGFASALWSVPMGLIAEVKRRSPSAGIIRDPFDPAAIARAYESAGAQAISVLMDEKFFGGGEGDFRVVRGSVPLPLLYKEFVVDPWQVWHAAALGASAVLLIAAVLSAREMGELLDGCQQAGVEALVEVHDEDEMVRISGLPITCVGVNNRNLHTFAVALETTLRLKDLAPKGSLLVSESGIRSAKDVARLKGGGVDAILVGEHLLKQPDPAEGIRELMKLVWRIKD